MTLYISTKDPKVISVALKQDRKILGKLVGQNEYGSEVLLPLIVQLINRYGVKFADLKMIELETGPGSFTGLRVGAAVAQALSFALNIPLNGDVNKSPNLKYTKI